MLSACFWFSGIPSSWTLCEYLDFSLMFCMPWNWICVFSQLALRVQDKKWWSYPCLATCAVFLQHLRIPTRVADARNKPLFHQKQAGARCECTICVFCELYFLSYLIMIFLQIHQICGTEKATDFCTKLPACGSTLWRCALGKNSWIVSCHPSVSQFELDDSWMGRKLSGKSFSSWSQIYKNRAGQCNICY